MKKLRLDDLVVESFETLSGFSGEPRRTVHANMRPSQDYACSMSAADCGGATMPCLCANNSLNLGQYTCDRPSCMYDCPSKYPCGDGGGTMSICNHYTNCTCAGVG